jgi:arylsulfatase A-like enzyme
MIMIKRKKIFIIHFIQLMLTSFLFQSIIAQEKPNIIFIMADDLGYGEVGSYGQQLIQTPNIDRLSTNGMQFSDYYSGAAVCAPARSVLMTGLHTGHTRVRGNFGKGGVIGLAGKAGRVPIKEEDLTVAEVLQDKGYHTGMIGKWGLGEPNTTGEPNQKGFDYFYGFYNQRRAHSYYPEYLWENTQKIILHGNQKEQRNQYTHNLFADKAINFIDRNHQKHFFLYLPVCIPHSRYEIPDNGIYSYKKDWTEKQKKYAAMVTRLDETVGRIVQRLEALGIAENTYIFFTSDNGPAEISSEWEIFNSNGDFRGMKRDPYEGGIRVPFIVYHPQKIKAGTRTNQVGYFADFFPTVLELIGEPIDKTFDGNSIAGILHGNQLSFERAPLYWEFYEKNGWRATRFGKWKAIQNNLHQGDQGPIEIYNLHRDPGETFDLSQSHPHLLDQAKKIFKTSSIPSEHYFWKHQQQGDIATFNN